MNQMNGSAGKIAVVNGGGISGMIAARVLSDFFESVIVIEQDGTTDTKKPRKFAPQGHHVHLMLGKGTDLLEDLFPGFVDDLEKLGAYRFNFYRGWKWFHYGSWRRRDELEDSGYVQTRPLLEYNLRRRTEAVSNIRFEYGSIVTGYLSRNQGKSVHGIRVRNVSHIEYNLEADLVVEAGGRNGKVMDFLSEINAPLPAEELREVRPGYTSLHFEHINRMGDDWDVMIVHPHAPHSSKAGFIFHIEDDHWHVSLGGNLVEETPDNLQSFLDYAKQLDSPAIYEAIKDARPINEITSIRIPAYRRRYFEKIKNPPERLIVVGDSYAVVNPIYGQGMMLAALEIDAFRNLLRKRSLNNRGLDGLTKEYFRDAGKWVDNAWLILASLDLSYPQFRDKRGLIINILIWYIDRLMKKCAYDEKIFAAFNKVFHFRKRALYLLRPEIFFRVLFA